MSASAVITTPSVRTSPACGPARLKAAITSTRAMSPRVQFFWCAFLCIYLCFQSFSCGRADRLWRVSDVHEHSVPVLLKPYGIAYLWYEAASSLIRPAEDAILVMMVSLAMAVPWVPLRAFSFLTGLGWLFLHSYEHSLTGGSHTHVLPAMCMMSLALPPDASITCIRWWNIFLLFSAGLSKLFNGDHHPWYAWMDGQSMRFYFENSRMAVPEPFYTFTMRWDWFAVAQCAGATVFELSTCLLFWRPYRLLFPLLATLFHGVIWWTLGVNYLTSVLIQWSLVLDAADWRHLAALAAPLRARLAAAARRAPRPPAPAPASATTVAPPAVVKAAQHDEEGEWLAEPTRPEAPGVARGVTVLTPAVMAVVIFWQVEYWPLTPIPMYSGYRPAAGYNLTHIANRTYLDHLVNEMAPHVWSRRWTDVVISDVRADNAYSLHFCAPAAQSHRGMKDACLVPAHLTSFDTEAGSQGALAHGNASAEVPTDVGSWQHAPTATATADAKARDARRKEQDSRKGRDEKRVQHGQSAVFGGAELPEPASSHMEARVGPTWFRPAVHPGNATYKTAMRPGGWGRQKPIVVVATLPGKAHVYCEHATLTPAEDFLYRNCAFLASTPWGSGRQLRAELLVRLGTGDLSVGAVECDGHFPLGYTADRMPPCVQMPWGHPRS